MVSFMYYSCQYIFPQNKIENITDSLVIETDEC
jgi:hypothetical protein